MTEDIDEFYSTNLSEDTPEGDVSVFKDGKLVRAEDAKGNTVSITSAQ